MLIVLTTVSSSAEAESLARGLIGQKLAACVQVLPGMQSFYFWEGEVQSDEERLLLVKTDSERLEAVEDYISANHSYDVPEIAAINTERVSGPYRKWLEDYLN